MPYYYQSANPTIPLPGSLNGSNTRLVGFIRDSGNMPITSGWLEVTADTLISDGSAVNKTLIVPKPYRVPLSSAPLNVEIVNSQYSETTYRFRVGETISGVDVIYADFHAQVPYGSSIDISSLIPQNITREQLPTTIYRVAELILDNPTLRGKLNRIFNFKGNWQANTEYQPYDLVFVAGSPNKTLICTTPHISTATINNTYWQQLI